jgi:hypothetical protein
MVHGQCHACCPPILPRGMAVTSFRCRAHQRAWLSIKRTATELDQIPTWAWHWGLLTGNQLVGGLPERAKGVSARAPKSHKVRAAQHPGNGFLVFFDLCSLPSSVLLSRSSGRRRRRRRQAASGNISHAPRVGIDLCPEQDVELLVVLSNIVPLTLCLRLANSSRPSTTEPFSRGYYQARSAETLSVRRSLAPQPTGCFTHLLAYL